MTSVFNIALSGMQAAAVRAASSAKNISNVQSSSSIIDGEVTSQPYLPQDIVQISDQNGGTITYTRPSNRPEITIYDPISGNQQLPDIDLADELVKTQQAAVDYKANLKVIGYAANIQSALLDIFV
jgi:flagellar basal body rod protein FlgC